MGDLLLAVVTQQALDTFARSLGVKLTRMSETYDSLVRAALLPAQSRVAALPAPPNVGRLLILAASSRSVRFSMEALAFPGRDDDHSGSW
jgi:hypothetical protein